jgi:ABC-type sugar transport system substrate-binding protein
VRAAYVDELRAASPGLAIGMVGTDQREVGRIQGRQVRALVGARGNSLVVQGPANAWATTDRFEGLKETLGSGFELRAVSGDWTEASGERAVADWLRLKTNEAFKPDVLVAQNDSMAAGARRALARGRQEWVALPSLGCDGLPAGGQKMVAERRLAATVVTPRTREGRSSWWRRSWARSSRCRARCCSSRDPSRPRPNSPRAPPAPGSAPEARPPAPV